MSSSAQAGLPVFILDCDNTLLDNDALKADLSSRLQALLGPARSDELWVLYEQVRAETGVVDYPLALERFRPRLHDEHLFAAVRAVVMDYPFAERLYPETLPTLAYLRAIGFPTIVSDGDQVYQRLKIEASGLAAAVNRHVLIYAHKEQHLEEIILRWPAPFYVMVDDKARILAATKARFPQRFVTVQVCQGHYGMEPPVPGLTPDLTLAHIGDLRALRIADLRAHLAESAGGDLRD
ncbi:MAG: HAD family hydrolase [Ktedonobacterales bacterium]